MNPKKFKNILDEITKEIDCDKELISSVVDFYWESVRKSVHNVTYPRINIESFGSFKLKPKVLQKTISKYKITMLGFKNPEFSKYVRYQALKDRVEILERASEQIKIEVSRYKQLKLDRYANIIRSMEEKGTNP